MKKTQQKRDICQQIYPSQDLLKLLVHRSQKIHIKTQKKFKTPAPKFQSPLPKSPNHSSKSPSCSKLPSIKSPILINSVEFPINYYDQLSIFIIPEFNKTLDRHIYNSVNPRVTNELKTRRFSDAGVAEFKPEFPSLPAPMLKRIPNKGICGKHQNKFSDFSKGADFQMNLVEKIKELLPVVEKEDKDEEEFEEKRVFESRKKVGNGKMKKVMKSVKVGKDDSGIKGWSLHDSETLDSN